MKQLPNKVNVNGIGIPGLMATLVKRTKMVAIYHRDDDVFETGIIKVSPAATIFGKDYPERETYFSTEDFGSTAFTARTLKQAESQMQRLLTRR